METLKISDLWLVTSLDQCIKSGLDQLGLPEEISLGFFLKGGFNHPSTGGSQTFGVSKGCLQGTTSGILVNGNQGWHPRSLFIFAPHQMTGTFGSNHHHIQVFGRPDLTEVDIKAVGKDQSLTLGHVGSNFVPV